MGVAAVLLGFTNTSVYEGGWAEWSARTPSLPEKEEISRDPEGNPVWDLGKLKKVVVRDYRGKTYIDIREFYIDNMGETRPGKKGISLNTLQYQKLKSVIAEIDQALP